MTTFEAGVEVEVNVKMTKAVMKGHHMTASEATAAAAVAAEEALSCPRCGSSNTKFCYYNNYNFSQPRHFCKACRRYWTRGGALRDVPVGGGSRKSAKRSRTNSPSSATSSATSSPTVAPASYAPLPAIPVFSGGSGAGFTSLLALGGLGLGLGLEEMGYGFGSVGVGIGRGGWGLPEVGFVGGNMINLNGSCGGCCGGGGSVSSGGDDGGCASSGGATWHVESVGGGNGGGGGGGGGGGDVFSLPELAISTSGNCLK